MTFIFIPEHYKSANFLVQYERGQITKIAPYRTELRLEILAGDGAVSREADLHEVSGKPS